MAIIIDLKPYCYKCTNSRICTTVYSNDTYVRCANDDFCKNAIKISNELKEKDNAQHDQT